MVRHNANAFMKKLKELSNTPNQVEMSLGLTAMGEVGDFAVAKAGTEANYTVKLTWKRDEGKRESEE